MSLHMFFPVISHFFISILLGWSAVAVYNRLPAEWLCDYGEQPGETHMPPRIGEKLFAVVFSAGFFFSFLRLENQFEGRLQVIAAGLAVLWIALQIALADFQYMIIPDQWLLALGLSGGLMHCLDLLSAVNRGEIGAINGVFHASVLSPLWGLIPGLLVLAVGSLAFRLTGKEVIGFGDVKLLFAVGVVFGLRRGIQILMMAFFVSGSLFAVLMLVGALKKGEAKPLGPFIMGAASCHLLFFHFCEDLSRWLFEF